VSEWVQKDYPCPVCGVGEWYRGSTDARAGRVRDEYECRFCHEWRAVIDTAATPNNAETIGFLTYSLPDVPPGKIPPGDPRRGPAIEEMKTLLRHPEYATMKRTLPDYAMADWLGEREPPCPVQGAALRETIRVRTELENAVSDSLTNLTPTPGA
jgi:hypothetical protein